MTSGPDALQVEAEREPPATGRSAHATVARNTAFLLVAQVLGMPLTLTTNAVMARRLGPDDFGYIYLAGQLVAFGFLAVDFGQSGALPALIAKDRSRSGALLGTGVVWRLVASVAVYGVLALISVVLGYGHTFQGVLVLVTLARVFGTLCAACLDAALGLENSALTAYSLVRYNFLCAGFVVPTLLLGGGLFGALLALLAADVVNTTFVWRGMRKFDSQPVSFRLEELRGLLSTGSAFMFLDLALCLQPIVDAVFLSKLGTPESMGWYAAARKLVGVLVFPVVAMRGGLYPTLCRLFAHDMAGFRKMAGTALRTSSVLVMPVALGTGLYPQLGIRIFSEASFGPAEDDLRVLAAFVFLVYFTMVLGSAIGAAGRQRPWAVAQFGCVVVSALVDPVLIPWFHHRTKNGGLGVCVSALTSEILMLVCGFFIAPRGLFDRRLIGTVGRTCLAGAAMVVVSRALASVNPFASATASVLAYGVCIWLVGGIDPDVLQTIRGAVMRKLGRAAGA
jgi:O-antigen/teichoic acid export membrane protein